MRELFKGWKRKVGCAALALAVAIFIAELRSFLILDLVCIPIQNDVHCFAAFHGNLAWTVLRDGRSFMGSGALSWRSESIPVNFHGPIAGFDADEWSFPYWKIAFVLTVLAACLIYPKSPLKPPAAL